MTRRSWSSCLTSVSTESSLVCPVAANTAAISASIPGVDRLGSVLPSLKAPHSRMAERLPALLLGHHPDQLPPADVGPGPAERLGHRLGHGHHHRGGGDLGVLEGDQHRLPAGLLPERDLERPGRGGRDPDVGARALGGLVPAGREGGRGLRRVGGPDLDVDAAVVDRRPAPLVLGRGLGHHPGLVGGDDHLERAGSPSRQARLWAGWLTKTTNPPIPRARTSRMQAAASSAVGRRRRRWARCLPPTDACSFSI